MSAMVNVTPADVFAALDQVRDPELDRSVVDLGFVESVSVDGGRVHVALRLPTYWCAANFSFLMVEDAHRAVSGLPGVTEVEVELKEHFAADEINAGVARGVGFREAFPDEAETDLDDIRARFARKGLSARLHRLCRSLLDQGMTEAQVATLRVGELPASREAAEYLGRRRELGLSTEPGSPLLVDERGRVIEAKQAEVYLAWIRAVAASLDGNTAYCRGLLATRYGVATPGKSSVAGISVEVRA